MIDMRVETVDATSRLPCCAGRTAGQLGCRAPASWQRRRVGVSVVVELPARCKGGLIQGVVNRLHLRERAPAGCEVFDVSAVNDPAWRFVVVQAPPRARYAHGKLWPNGRCGTRSSRSRPSQGAEAVIWYYCPRIGVSATWQIEAPKTCATCWCFGPSCLEVKLIIACRLSEMERTLLRNIRNSSACDS